MRIISKERLDYHPRETNIREQYGLKINELLIHSSTDNIMELNELIYAGAKFICDKVGVPLKNMNGNSKPGRKIRLESFLRNPRQQAKW